MWLMILHIKCTTKLFCTTYRTCINVNQPVWIIANYGNHAQLMYVEYWPYLCCVVQLFFLRNPLLFSDQTMLSISNVNFPQFHPKFGIKDLLRLVCVKFLNCSMMDFWFWIDQHNSLLNCSMINNYELIQTRFIHKGQLLWGSEIGGGVNSPLSLK